MLPWSQSQSSSLCTPLLRHSLKGQHPPACRSRPNLIRTGNTPGPHWKVAGRERYSSPLQVQINSNHHEDISSWGLTCHIFKYMDGQFADVSKRSVRWQHIVESLWAADIQITCICLDFGHELLFLYWHRCMYGRDRAGCLCRFQNSTSCVTTFAGSVSQGFLDGKSTSGECLGAPGTQFALICKGEIELWSSIAHFQSDKT